MDSRTNKIVWQKHSPGSEDKGEVSTAGGLVFSGGNDGNLRAFDANTGDQLWSFQTGWPIGAPPMVWGDGTNEYVTVAAGSNRSGESAVLDGDAVWTFSLTGGVDEAESPPPVLTKVAITGTQVGLGGTVGTATTLGGTWTFEGTAHVLDFRFDPMRIAVPVGTTVSWENQGSTIHTVTATDGTFDSGDLAAGDTFSVTFDTPGTYVYSCTPHPWMIADIQIK
jgi:alcohol dehydrogenase (cytochrome c)